MSVIGVTVNCCVPEALIRLGADDGAWQDETGRSLPAILFVSDTVSTEIRIPNAHNVLIFGNK